MDPLVKPVAAVGAAIVQALNGADYITAAIDRALKLKNDTAADLQALQKECDLKKTLLPSMSEEEKKVLESEIAGLEANIKTKKEALERQSKLLEESQKTTREQANSARQREKDIIDRRVEVQTKLREANAELAGLVSRLANTKIEKA